MTSTSRGDLLNTLLALLACAAAYIAPFELFLFAYAVLGPLHYLTEIAWLRQRSYFLPQRRDGWVLGGLAALLALVFYISLTTAHGPTEETSSRSLLDIAGWTGALSFFALGAALAMVITQNKTARAAVYALLAFLAAALTGGKANAVFILLCAVLLPTLIHVLLFTAAFMLHGALQARSAAAMVSVATLAVCAISFFLTPAVVLEYRVSSYAQANYEATLAYLNYHLLGLFSNTAANADSLYHSELGLAFARLIAFSYTFHYLNWFAKTSRIQWHKVSLSAWITVISGWIASVALYAWDYRSGATALYFLSMLHVYLEFPLNWRCFDGIRRQLHAPGQMRGNAFK